MQDYSYNGFGDIGVSDASYIIQVKVNQKWSTATRLSSDAVLRKLMPPLQHEYGDVVRALQGEKDTFSGKTKWYLYEPEQNGPPCASNTNRTWEHQDPAPALEQQAEEPKAKVLRKPRRKLEFRKRVLTPVSRAFAKLVVKPLANRANTLADLARAFMAIPNKMDRVKSAASNLAATTNALSKDPRTQWLECALAMSIGLTLAFTATMPGGLTLAVLSGFLIPPVRHHVGSVTPGFATPVRKVVAVFLLLITSGSLELMTPDRRQANVTLDFFMTNREAIIADAQSALDTLDYVAVVKQLEPYEAIDDVAIVSLIEAAQPNADIELARLKKITSQFLFNGSNRYLTEYIVKAMDDPGSFRHLNTDYWVHDEYLEVQTTYSSFNEAGTTVAKTVKAFIDFDGKSSTTVRVSAPKAH